MQYLLALLISLHLISGGLAAMGPIAAPLLEWFAARRQMTTVDAPARQLAHWSFIALLVSIGCGLLLWVGPQWWYTQPEHWQYASRLQKLWVEQPWGFWSELLFSVISLAIGLYAWRMNWRAGWRRFWLLASGTNLAYHLPMRMLILRVLSDEPQFANTTWTRDLKYEVLARQEFWARLTHHWLTMVIVTAVVLLLLLLRRTPEQPVVKVAGLRMASGLALLATVLQFACGCWLLIVSNDSIQQAYVGGKLAASAWLVSGILFAATSIPGLFSLAFGTGEMSHTTRLLIKLCSLLSLCAIVAMCCATIFQRGC